MIVQTYNIPLLMDDANATHWYNLLVCARDAYNKCTRILYESKVSLSLKKVHHGSLDLALVFALVNMLWKEQIKDLISISLILH